MAKSKILINKKTGKEFPTNDPDAVLKKYPKTFRIKPDAEVSPEVKAAEAKIGRNIEELKLSLSTIEDAKELDVIYEQEVAGSNRKGAIEAINNRKSELEATYKVDDKK